MMVLPIVSGVPYMPNPKPVVVGSIEWCLLQLLGLLSAVLSGMSVARWSKSNSWSSLLVVIFIVLSFSILSPIQTDSVLLLAIWIFEIPIGLLIGFSLFNRYRSK